MPYYFFFRESKRADSPHYDFLEQCENHEEAAAKERAYTAATLERGEPVVYRVHAKTVQEARSIIEKYGPKPAPPNETS